MADIPGASIYGQGVAAGKSAYQNALARINRQRSTALRSFGYQGDVDQEHGTIKNMRVDPNNPYGQYQSMLRSHALQAGQAQGMAQQRGLSTAGGLGAQYERDLQHNFGDDSSRLGQTFSDLLFQLQDQQNQAKYDYDAALYEGQLQAARGAYESGDFSYDGYGQEQYPQFDDYGPPQTPTTGVRPGGRTTPKPAPRKVTPGNYSNSKKKPVNTKQNPFAFRAPGKPRGGSR